MRSRPTTKKPPLLSAGHRCRMIELEVHQMHKVQAPWSVQATRVANVMVTVAVTRSVPPWRGTAVAAALPAASLRA